MKKQNNWQSVKLNKIVISELDKIIKEESPLFASRAHVIEVLVRQKLQELKCL